MLVESHHMAVNKSSKLTIVTDRPLCCSVQVYIEVEDVNDHLPETEEPSYRVYVPEDTPPSTPIVTLVASDGDRAGRNGSTKQYISFFIKSIRGRRNSHSMMAFLGEEGWNTVANGDEIFNIERKSGVIW